MVNKYEALLLFHPEVGTDGRRETLDKFAGVINSQGGQIVEEDDWGKRTLAYPIQKVTRGHYVRLEFALEGTAVTELERRIRITDGIMKFLTVKLADNFEPQAEEAA
ncbi:30S ribosomal protein S6 [Desulfohalobium retbaense]|uniref:Small ribosomal subunit protein bS6 n=1 Tax=Desulfohalobium retbaense (strain ATCC 49708 / DSM 5692 / JCM 16813 / HR100) TaxID=485915 RepID=C8X259_DESRD|nr:30S ribosomal protein S6 [Desulfohalobium retbaense]ACV68382.1 ribosomal protein S6 [Desulfohalobium retbaense DSM 5692]